MRKNKSAILEAVHETAKGLNAAGAMDQVIVLSSNGQNVDGSPMDAQSDKAAVAIVAQVQRQRNFHHVPTGIHVSSTPSFQAPGSKAREIPPCLEGLGHPRTENPCRRKAGIIVVSKPPASCPECDKRGRTK